MFELGLTALLLVVGYLFGSSREKKHFEDLRKREDRLLQMPCRADKGPKLERGESFLVSANVVVASDYFKNFVGNIRNFFGGRLKNHESLLDRARREAMCRMRESAQACGAHMVVDVHIETQFLDAMGVEVAVYGTAVKL